MHMMTAPTLDAAPETPNALARAHTRWAVRLGTELAETTPGWDELAGANPLLAEDVGDAILQALSVAIRRHDPADGDFREWATPQIRKAVAETIAARRFHPTEIEPEPIPTPREKEGPPMSLASATNGHAPHHGVSRLVEIVRGPDPAAVARTVTVESGRMLTSADLTPRDRDSLKRLAFANPDLQPAAVAELYAAESGRHYDARSVRFLSKALGFPLAPAEVRERRGKPRHVPRNQAVADDGRDVPRAAKGKGGRPKGGKNKDANGNFVSAPTPAPPIAPAPSPTDARAGMRAVAALMKVLRGLDPATAREALAVAAEAFDDAA